MTEFRILLKIVSMSSYWEYRVVCDFSGELVVAEVYYDAFGGLESWCAADVAGFKIEVLDDILGAMVHATHRPVIDAKRFPHAP